jgi:HTH-type transcriptional regulator/antitoxin HigA
MAARRPAEVFPPGEFLREELEERGWTQTDLAEILGRPFPLVNEIISGKRRITPETAVGLSAALGTSPEFWLNLEVAYQLGQVGRADYDPVVRRARLFELAPIKEIVRRGWIEPSDSVDLLEARVLRFLEISGPDETPQFRAAARKATTYESHSSAQRAWLFRARQLARAVDVAPFTPAKLERALAQLKQLAHAPQELRHVPRTLAEAGVRFVVVQPLTGTKIDGACFWLDDASPVVAVSLRYDRIDHFWFVLLHECAHVKHRDGSVDSDLGEMIDHADRPPEEQQADRFASDYLVPQQQLDRFIARVQPLYSATRIEGFARMLGVHPGIVVGQLQHRREVSWASFRKWLAPVRNVVTATALTDGWGATVPAIGS